MTTEETAKATTNSKPKEGEELVYIDWQGNKLHAKPDAHSKSKTKDTTK